jgi:RNA polymerase sigma-70 factor (ECF subfamily)
VKRVKYSEGVPADGEHALVARFNAGDERAFDRIVSLYKDRVYSMAYRVIGDPDEAEECAQDVFVRIYRSLGSFEGRSALSTWIYRVTFNLIRDYTRKMARRGKRLTVSIDAHDGAITPPDTRSDPERVALENERAGQIQRALRELDPLQRELIVLSDIEGKGYDEIASITHVPLGTVKSRISRGRGKLRELLRGVL